MKALKTAEMKNINGGFDKIVIIDDEDGAGCNSTYIPHELLLLLHICGN